MRYRFFAIAVVVGALALAGCGVISGPPTAGAHDAGTGMACPPAAFLHRMLGGNAGEPVRQDEDDGFFCLYDDPSGPNQYFPGTGSIRVYADATPATFAAARADLAGAKLTLTDLPGLGDQAFGYLGEHLQRVIARKGSIQLDVFANTSVDRMKAYVQKLFTDYFRSA